MGEYVGLEEGDLCPKTNPKTDVLWSALAWAFVGPRCGVLVVVA